MIIDEILDNRYNGTVRFKDLDLAYIKTEAEIFGFDYLVEAIDRRDRSLIIEALKTYMWDNGYDSLLKETNFI